MSFGLLLLRLALGVIFIAHGSQKVLGWFGGPGLAGFAGHIQQMGFPLVLGYMEAFIEFLGGIGVLFGLLTRLSGLGITTVMGVAVWQVHWKSGLFLNFACDPAKGHGFEYNLALIGMALCLVFAGAGKISLDALIRGEGGGPNTIG